MPRTNWSPTEIATARKLSAEGKTSPEIAAVVGRPAASVRRVLGAAPTVGAVASGDSIAANSSASLTGSREVMGKVRSPIPMIGSMKPGRYHVAQITDVHHGSKFCDCKALLDFMQIAADRECTAVVMTGDLIDGQKACLTHEQRAIGADDQLEEAVEVWGSSAIKRAGIPVVAIGGNHCGYAHAATGTDVSRVLGERMKGAGIDWTYLGMCLGRAVIHGAKWELWHPMGAGSTRNAVRRILNARAEAFQVHDRPDVLAIGHYHRHCTVMAYPERVYCVSGGTFQRKGSEFANRITGGWDVGASIVSYSVDNKGNVGEFACEFFPVESTAAGWAA